MKWDERLVEKARHRAREKVAAHQDRTVGALAEVAPFLDVQRLGDAVMIRGRRLFKAIAESPSLRSALRGWS